MAYEAGISAHSGADAVIVPESTAPFGTWQAGDSSPAIEYSLAVLEEIRAQAVGGFHSFGHGGLETGGVLYGAIEDGVARVLGSAELTCEHALGPGFVLSENDRAEFERLLQAPPGLEAVGWYVSHTRSSLSLSASDSEIFDRFFGRPGAIALIIKPASLGPSQAAFCYRGEDGEIRSGGPEHRFLVDAAPRRRALEQTVVEPARAEEAPAPVEFVSDQRGGPSGPPPRFRAARLPKIGGSPEGLPRKWLWAAAGTVAIAAALLPLMRRAPERLELHAHEISAGQVRIEWNRGAAAALGAASGLLEIEDGASHLRVPLSGEQLRTSSITYAHQSPRVSVRLRVQPERGGGAPLEEALAYTGKPAPAAAPAPATQSAGIPVAPAPATSEGRVEADLPRAGSSLPHPAVEPAPTRPEVAERSGAERVAEAPPRQAAPPRRLAVIPASPAPQAHPPVVLPGPPPVAPGAPAPATALTLPAHFPAPAPPPPRAQAYAGPRSGRLIWTGALARRGVVEIEGSHASVGSLAGALPGVPVSLRISPAGFASDGLVVYSADAARNGKVEPASAANGWNGARFEWDPERAREIAILEAPNPSNQFKRLALRNDVRNCAVIFIEWSVQ